MYPIALDLTRIPIALVGRGDIVLRRIRQLDEAGAGRLVVFCDEFSPEIQIAAGGRLESRLPYHEELEAATIIMGGGLTPEESQALSAKARELGKLVNIEDVNDLCDFYFTANVKRGDLTIAVSTAGASPTLARKVRDAIAAMFGAEWKERTEEIKFLRLQWKSEGKSMGEVIAASEEKIAGWLS